MTSVSPETTFLFVYHKIDFQTIFEIFGPPQFIYFRIILEPLIMGGEEAEDGYAPYQCSIQFAKNKTHQCGCSIISSNWILTAAQCVRECVNLNEIY